MLNGQCALVTGGSKGIGYAVVRSLVSEGCRVVVVSRDARRLARLREALGPNSLFPICADLTEPEAAARVTAEAVELVGTPDILVNSAGSSQGGLFWSLDDKVWEDSFALKVMGTVRMLRAVVPLMAEQRRGRVVTIVGNNGRQPSARFLPGSAANAALLAVTKGLADEVAPAGVVINAVNPGPTRTERWTGLMVRAAADTDRTVEAVEMQHLQTIPSGRLNEPDEIARYVTFLCSPLATAATGTSVTIDGGATRGLA